MAQTGQQWIASLEGLSDDPTRRAAQIALAAIDRYLNGTARGEDTELEAAYDALQTALAV